MKIVVRDKTTAKEASTVSIVTDGPWITEAVGYTANLAIMRQMLHGFQLMRYVEQAPL